MRWKEKNFYYFFILSLFFLSPVLIWAMQSNKYTIEVDSINLGGLDESSSENYRAKDTVGENIVGVSESLNYIEEAGYKSIESEDYIAFSATNNHIQLPDIQSLIPVSEASSTWNIKTNSYYGYSLRIRASTSPALKSGENYFADYVPADQGSGADYDWVSSSSSQFGFSVFNAGGNSNSKFHHDNSTCGGAGSNESIGKCWVGFSDQDQEIVRRNSNTGDYSIDDLGEDTRIDFKAEMQASQAHGSYIANFILTVVLN